LNGQGVPQDYAEAVKWYRKAADQGLAEAQYNLGSCYAKGQGVPKDLAEMVKWYRKAADQGLAQAQYRLGLCYLDGQGVPRDVQAYMWLDLAGQTLEQARKMRDEVGSKMTPQQIAEAQKLSRDWEPKKEDPSLR
jgi:TPR repeat protein